MFSHSLYNVVHIVGLVLLISGLGGVACLGALTSVPRRLRRLLMMLHGLGVFLILLGGFGMLARLGIVRGSSWPGWVWVKVIIWGALGASAFLPNRFPRTAVPLILLIPVLAGVAAYMAIYKPL